MHLPIRKRIWNVLNSNVLTGVVWRGKWLELPLPRTCACAAMRASAPPRLTATPGSGQRAAQRAGRSRARAHRALSVRALSPPVVVSAVRGRMCARMLPVPRRWSVIAVDRPTHNRRTTCPVKGEQRPRVSSTCGEFASPRRGFLSPPIRRSFVDSSPPVICARLFSTRSVYLPSERMRGVIVSWFVLCLCTDILRSYTF